MRRKRINFCKQKYNNLVTSSKQTRVGFTAGPSCVAQEPEIYSKAEQSREIKMANARRQISITKRVCPKFCGFRPKPQQGQRDDDWARERGDGARHFLDGFPAHAGSGASAGPEPRRLVPNPM